MLTPEGRDELDGIGRADSVTLDPHKRLAQTFEAGCVLVRDGRLLRQAFTLRPEYMQDVEPADDEVNFADHGMALTRRFRALKIWLSMKVLGVGWFRALAERCRRLAELCSGPAGTGRPFRDAVAAAAEHRLLPLRAAGTPPKSRPWTV